ncbi:MAG: NAD(P)/FAD-dependent oxidoreductase, partial [Lachnospiraceae bacterium]
IAVSGIFIAVGIIPNSEIYKDYLELDKQGYIIADEDTVTSKQGVFAGGDVRTKQLRQIVTAVSDGANAVTSVERYMNEVKL